MKPTACIPNARYNPGIALGLMLGIKSLRYAQRQEITQILGFALGIPGFNIPGSGIPSSKCLRWGVIPNMIHQHKWVRALVEYRHNSM